MILHFVCIAPVHELTRLTMFDFASNSLPGTLFVADPDFALSSYLEDLGSASLRGGCVVLGRAADVDSQLTPAECAGLGMVVYVHDAGRKAAALRVADFWVAPTPRSDAVPDVACKWWKTVGEFSIQSSVGQPSRDYTVREFISKDEEKYLRVLRKIVDRGFRMVDRTQVGCRQLIGKTLTYDITDYRLPLFTHRKMFYRGIVEVITVQFVIRHLYFFRTILTHC